MNTRHVLSVFLLLLFSFLFLSANIFAQGYEYETLFFDDFYDGSTENWAPLIGTWEVFDAQYCQEACGSG